MNHYFRGLILIALCLALEWAATAQTPAKGVAKAEKAKLIDANGTTKSPEATFKVVELRGKVMPYKAALDRLFGIKLAEHWGEDLLALETEQGELLPILPTDGARFFHQDPTMLGRPMQLTARVHERTPGLQIIKIHSLKDGKLHEIYYWCSVCAIKVYQLQTCECCQGEIELREHPVGEPFRIPSAGNAASPGAK